MTLQKPTKIIIGVICTVLAVAIIGGVLYWRSKKESAVEPIGEAKNDEEKSVQALAKTTASCVDCPENEQENSAAQPIEPLNLDIVTEKKHILEQ